MQKITSLVFSDIHLGAKRTPSEFIINNLNTLIPDNESMSKVDVIYLAGDVFDSNLHFPDDEIDIIQLWIVRLLRLCAKWDIVLRVLEGTPSHDRTQSKRFESLNKMFDIGADCRYIDTLYIEENKKLGINILYVPDEYHSDNSVTLKEVKDLLAVHGLDKVDYAIMHGMFEHQVPNGITLPTHNAEEYLGLVKKYIFIGHIHQMSQMDRILSQGSTDRLCHGEEEDKGGWLVEAYRDSFESDQLTFIVNKNAKVFKTYDVVGKTAEEVTTLLNEIGALPDESYVRILVEKDDPNTALVHSFKAGYPRHTWEIKRVKDKRIVGEVAVAPSTFIPLNINPNTIESIMVKRLEDAGETQDTINTVMELLSSNLK